MNKLLIVTAMVASMSLAQPALADYNPLRSALIGGIAGAIIGGAVDGRDGAAVGAAIGGVSGAVISSGHSRSYYYGGYNSAPVIYTQQTYYQQPVQPRYYQEPTRVAYYPTAYYPVQQQVVYPVSYTEYRGYRHHRDNDWHRGWDRDRDDDRGYSNY